MKKLIIFTILTCMLSSVAAASELEPKIVYDYSNNEVRVSADAGESGKRVSLQILNEGFTFEDLKNTKEDIEKILYVKQANGITGEFTFVVSYGSELEAGLHNARLVVGDERVDIENLNLVSGEVFEAAVDSLNEAAAAGDFSEFKKSLDENAANLGFNSDELSKLKDDEAMKSFMSDIKTAPLSKTDAVSNTKRFNTYLLMGLLYDGVLENADTLITDSLLADSEVLAEYEKYITTESEQEYLTDKMLGARYSEVADLEEGIRKAILLNEIYYAEGYEAVQNIISEYGDEAGISSVSKTVAKGLIGKDFDDTDELNKKCVELAKASSSSSPSSGGPSSSGGGKNIFAGNVVTDITPDNNQAPVRKNAFTDIEGVDWAVESINALFDKGIINGRTETLFEPDEFITREEFVKILVVALGYQNEAYGENVFADVSDSDWFVSYVNIAHRKNLVKGIGDNNFGSGSLISRQDMALMVYNTLQSKGIECPEGEHIFSDEADLADYAKSAVKALYEMGVVNGVSETEFDPNGNATRAQAAKIVYGILSYIA